MQRVDFADFSTVHPGDMRTLCRVNGHNALGLKLAKGIANWHPAEAELRGQFILAQRSARLYGSVGNRFAQDIGDLLGDRARPLNHAFGESWQSMREPNGKSALSIPVYARAPLGTRHQLPDPRARLWPLTCTPSSARRYKNPGMDISGMIAVRRNTW